MKKFRNVFDDWWPDPMIALGMLGGGGVAPLTLPDSAFSFLPFLIYPNGDGTFNIGSWDISAQVSRAGGNRYVSKSGNDTTGNGLSWDTAWKTIGKAYTVLGSTANICIHVGEGLYGLSDGAMGDVTLTVDRSMIGYGNCRIDAYWAGGSFALTAGQTYTYEQTTLNNSIDAVLDYGTLDTNGDPTPYTVKASIAEVEAIAGTFWNNGTTLYVHTLDGLTPSANVRPQYLGGVFVKIAGTTNNNFYAENFTLYHTRIQALSTHAANPGKVYFKSLRCLHNAISMEFNVTGYTAFLQNCLLSNFGGDTITGNIGSGGTPAKICAIDCTSRNAGKTGLVGKNAYTNHGASVDVIIGGEYSGCYGPNVASITGGKGWYLGVNSHNSVSASDNQNYYFQNWTAWLDSCISSGSAIDIKTNVATYVRNMTTAGNNDLTGGGSIVAY